MFFASCFIFYLALALFFIPLASSTLVHAILIYISQIYEDSLAQHLTIESVFCNFAGFLKNDIKTSKLK